jgi:hypothetical protein
MVLCPFVFVLTSPESPSLSLQPAEVAATHWVPIRSLLCTSLRTRELVEVSSRFGKSTSPQVSWVLRLLLGKMMFSAIRLVPSESLFTPSSPPVRRYSSAKASFFSRLARGAIRIPLSPGSSGPLLAWGISLGVLVDLLEMLPPHNAVELWRFPTFTAPDLRLLIYLFTYRLRKDNARLLNSGTWPSRTAVDESNLAIAISEAEPVHIKPDHTHTRETGTVMRQSPALNLMISGYYERMNIAIAVFLVLRFTTAAALGYYTIRSWTSRTRKR